MKLNQEHLRIPVLIKKYVKQNARLVAFNVDPKFNNAVDGLMYIRVADIPESTVKPVMEEFQAELESRLENENNEAETLMKHSSFKINLKPAFFIGLICINKFFIRFC